MTSPAAPHPVLPTAVPLLRVDGTTILDAVLRLADAQRIQNVVVGWVPLLRKHRTPDAGWTWAAKTTDDSLCYTRGVEHVMITHEGRVQAVMVTSMPNDRPPLSEIRDLLYVEYVAVAPWNRPLPGERQVFRKIGQLLLAYAADRSRREGREGRLGLHSELDPHTLRFYEKTMHILPRGADPEQEGREYFEGDEAWAATLPPWR